MFFNKNKFEKGFNKESLKSLDEQETVLLVEQEELENGIIRIQENMDMIYDKCKSVNLSDAQKEIAASKIDSYEREKKIKETSLLTSQQELEIIQNSIQNKEMEKKEKSKKGLIGKYYRADIDEIKSFMKSKNVSRKRRQKKINQVSDLVKIPEHSLNITRSKSFEDILKKINNLNSEPQRVNG